MKPGTLETIGFLLIICIMALFIVGNLLKKLLARVRNALYIEDGLKIKDIGLSHEQMVRLAAKARAKGITQKTLFRDALLREITEERK